MKFKNKLLLRALIFLVLALVSSRVEAEDSVQPYIDQLKKEMKEKKSDTQTELDSEGPDPYIQSIRKKLNENQAPSLSNKSYIEELKSSDPLMLQPIPEVPFTEQEKAKLEPKKEGGAIQALAEGRSELKPRIDDKIHHAFGFRYGISVTRNFTASSGVLARDFNGVYGSNYAPDMSLFYEFQPFHSEWFGNIGIFGMGGVSYYHAVGQFAFPLPNPTTGGSFPETTGVKFQFFTVPITVGLDYRFNLFRFIRPYFMAGPTLVGYIENRSDSIPGNRGNSRGLFAVAGVAIPIGWVSSESTWNLYQNYGFKRLYLTADYSILKTFWGDVTFNVSGFYAGITFEY